MISPIWSAIWVRIGGDGHNRRQPGPRVGLYACEQGSYIGQVADPASNQSGRHQAIVRVARDDGTLNEIRRGGGA